MSFLIIYIYTFKCIYDHVYSLNNLNLNNILLLIQYLICKLNKEWFVRGVKEEGREGELEVEREKEGELEVERESGSERGDFNS